MTTARPALSNPPKGADSSEGFDIRGVISGSTSDVALSELSKKGFKQVKVLNQGVIQRLISEAVDRVISSRAQKIGREEREKVIHESKSQFEALAKERIQRERDRIGELERANESLIKETEDLRRRLKESEAEVQRLGEQPAAAQGSGMETLMASLMERLQGMTNAPGGNLGHMEKSLEAIASKLERLQAGSGGGSEIMDKDVLLDALFRTSGGIEAESNMGQVKIKEAKAGGVKGTLAKLKALQKGGGKDGDS